MASYLSIVFQSKPLLVVKIIFLLLLIIYVFRGHKLSTNEILNKRYRFSPNSENAANNFPLRRRRHQFPLNAASIKSINLIKSLCGFARDKCVSCGKLDE